MIRSNASSTLVGEPGSDQRPGDGRPAEGVVVAGVERGDLGVDRHADLAQAVDGPREPLAGAVALGRHRRLERLVVRVHPEPEDVELALPQPEVAGDEGVDLDARDQRHPGGDRTGRDHVAIAGERVVVGQREDADAGRGNAARRAATGRQDAVGAGRVRVQVDGRRRAAGRPRRSRRRPAVVATTWAGPPRSDLDQPLDPLDRERPAGGRVDVDLRRR